MSLKHLLTKLNPFSKQEEKKEEKIEEPLSPEVLEVLSEEKEERPNKVQKNWKLSEVDKQLIVSMHATGLTPSEVVERARTEHNIEVSISQVYQYSKQEKWQPLIKKIREKHLEDISSVAGSHKKVRLQRAEHVYDKAISKNKFDLALKATESQRKEMEDNQSIHLTLNQFNMLSDEELILKQREALEKVKVLSQKKGITLEQPTDKTETTGS